MTQRMPTSHLLVRVLIAACWTMVAWGQPGLFPAASSCAAEDSKLQDSVPLQPAPSKVAPAVRRLLARRCLACHGPDESRRQADLRLDDASSLRRVRGDRRVVTPGEPDHSELLRRVMTDDQVLRMPPPDLGDPLTPAEIDLLRDWIAAGAEVVAHWSLQPPHRTAPRRGMKGAGSALLWIAGSWHDGSTRRWGPVPRPPAPICCDGWLSI